MDELKNNCTISKKQENETKKLKRKDKTNKDIVHSNITRNYKWSQTNIDNARRKINKEIFERDKQSSILHKKFKKCIDFYSFKRYNEKAC